MKTTLPVLKACPLCGWVPDFVYDWDYYADHEFKILCPNEGCGLTLPVDGRVKGQLTLEIEAKYVDKWNTRV